MNHCAMTGRSISGPEDAIWEDGEWISWDYINSQLDALEDGTATDYKDDPKWAIFERLLSVARAYHMETGRHLQIFGEIGELYGEVRFGVRRHLPHAQGSDGKIGDDFIEIKTISPGKRKQVVQVKFAGNFSKLLVVRISPDYDINAKLISKSSLKKRRNGMASFSWNSIEEEK